jgi:hypothetical protein
MTHAQYGRKINKLGIKVFLQPPNFKASSIQNLNSLAINEGYFRVKTLVKLPLKLLMMQQ